MPESFGTVAIVLHSHIPYVLGHNQLEEEWLFEAVAESYLPLLQGFRRLMLQDISPQVTLGLTPVLLEQLADPRFASRFVSYIERKTQAARDDQRTFQARNEAPLARLAGLWEIYYRHTATFFQNELAADIIGGFRQLQTVAQAEILASAATHAYLPLLGTDANVQAQIEIGTACYQHYFGTAAQGCWLPECAYRPAGPWTLPLGTPLIDGVPAPGGGQPVQRQGIDHILTAAGLQYCMIDQPQLTKSFPDSARPSPLHVHRIETEHQSASSESMAIFTRDFETTARVWQHDDGYPGDPWYLEFHKKHAEGELRYWRITDRQADLGAKQPYLPESAYGMVSAHAAQFATLVRERLRTHWEETQEKGIVVAAFDTELFGHWWFEGPQWLTEVIRHIDTYEDVTLTTCGAFLHDNAPQRPVRLIESSWGEGGDHRVWLDDTTQAFWRDVYQAETAMQQLGEAAYRKKGKEENDIDELERRILQQAGRELLLLQSSDWPFMITRQSTPDHAERRIALHHKNFQHCIQMAEQYQAGETLAENDWHVLEQMERQQPLFQDLDPSIFWPSPEQIQPRQEEQGESSISDQVSISQPSDTADSVQPKTDGTDEAAKTHDGALSLPAEKG